MINIYSVRNHLETEGWFLISDTYHNLTTPLKMKCPKGHVVEETYGNWRKNEKCPYCDKARPKTIKRPVPEKAPNVYRVLGLDAATNTSGYSVYDNGQLVSWGIYKTNGELKATGRINEFKHWLQNVLQEWQPDFVGVEHIQLQSFPHDKATHSYGGHQPQQVELYRVLANLQGVVMDTLYENEVPGDLVRPSEWRHSAGIQVGAQDRDSKKKQAQDKVKHDMGIDCTQDEADAILIGRYFVKNSSYWEDEAEVWGESW